MSFAVTSLGSVGDTNGRSTYTCSVKQAPDANALVLVGVVNTMTAGTVTDPSSVSGCGIVFSILTSGHSFNAAQGTETHNLTVWRGMSPSPVSSVISVLLTGSGSGCAILVEQVSGVSTSGTSGANAVSKVSVQDDTGGADSAITVVAGSATSTANAWFSFGGVGTGAVDTPGLNWTALQGATYATPGTGMGSAWTTLSTGTTSVWTGGSQRRAAVILELVLDNPSIVTPATVGVQGRRFRIPEVPPSIGGPLGSYLKLVVKQLNQEGWISLFSGADPNTSGYTGIPGNLLVNIGSASTSTRLWGMIGSVASVSTNSWRPFRIA